jgi:hypothetical protein
MKRGLNKGETTRNGVLTARECPLIAVTNRDSRLPKQFQAELNLARSCCRAGDGSCGAGQAGDVCGGWWREDD